MTELLSYVATSLVLLAVYYISKPKLRGQYLIVCADVTWATYAVLTKQYALLAQSAILLCIGVSALKNWSAKGIEF